MEKMLLEMLEENNITPSEKETLLQHLACAKKLALDKVVRVWRDNDKILCVEYGDGSWFHYNGKGEWY